MSYRPPLLHELVSFLYSTALTLSSLCSSDSITNLTFASTSYALMKPALCPSSSTSMPTATVINTLSGQHSNGTPAAMASSVEFHPQCHVHLWYPRLDNEAPIFVPLQEPLQKDPVQIPQAISPANVGVAAACAVRTRSRRLADGLRAQPRPACACLRAQLPAHEEVGGRPACARSTSTSSSTSAPATSSSVLTTAAALPALLLQAEAQQLHPEALRVLTAALNPPWGLGRTEEAGGGGEVRGGWGRTEEAGGGGEARHAWEARRAGSWDWEEGGLGNSVPQNRYREPNRTSRNRCLDISNPMAISLSCSTNREPLLPKQRNTTLRSPTSGTHLSNQISPPSDSWSLALELVLRPVAASANSPLAIVLSLPPAPASDLPPTTKFPILAKVFPCDASSTPPRRAPPTPMTRWRSSRSCRTSRLTPAAASSLSSVGQIASAPIPIHQPLQHDPVGERARRHDPVLEYLNLSRPLPASVAAPPFLLLLNYLYPFLDGVHHGSFLLVQFPFFTTLLRDQTTQQS
ncbi:hypothetical protein HU200_011509 [Digitaria exilis]|uniref:Uncharacterized protein n=1 Tax=Digitaria exilis TaxID=1010633 RepID=A0A835FG69_9POAL|nr:hypothetical protein HU200_011509 [Digitaria exilis]